MPKYIYQPLEKPNSEFRLVRISKNPRTLQPRCSLQKYSLINCPRYTALSYTWGEPTPTHSVAVDRAHLEVRQNLFDFLHAYTVEAWGMGNQTLNTDWIEEKIEKPVFYWIDQICINQEDPTERSDQVRIMSKIYKQAKNVLIWLGCDPTMMEAARRLRDKEDHPGTRAIDILLSHPYFSRIWIIQEIALSVNEPLFVCGGVELNWERVCLASSHPRNFQAAVWAAIWESARNQGKRTLQECIVSYCESDCHDPRDKVYGLLGLTSERWRVRVDYTKEVLEVFFDAVAALCEEIFDKTDPECLYRYTMHSQPSCRQTLHTLYTAMGLSGRHSNGVYWFLEHIQATYFSTKIRNVQYTYTGRICTRVQAQPSSEGVLAPEEEVEVSWRSITATRRNPLMRDIIPEMGLQLANPTAESIAGPNGDSVPAGDRWWYKHEGKIHYFDCDHAVAGTYRRRRKNMSSR